MNINKTAEPGKLALALEGRLDTGTAPQLEAELKTSLGGVKELVQRIDPLYVTYEYITRSRKELAEFLEAGSRALK